MTEHRAYQEIGNENFLPEKKFFTLLPKNLYWMLHVSPAFIIHSSSVKVLTEPEKFYQELLSRASRAKNKISLSSLYLGIGKLENDLINAIRENSAQSKELKVLCLFDYTRGTRGLVNSCTLLSPLLSASSNCQISLYHTPKLRGLLKWFMPQKWNETIGLQHIKLYIFDDSLIISGANLSSDYFTHRQDRYILFEDCPELVDFYNSLITVVAKYSLQLRPDWSFQMKSDVDVHPFQGDYYNYCNAVKTSVQKFWDKEVSRNHQRISSFNNSIETRTLSSSVGDTVVFPTVQMGVFGITVDSYLTMRLLLSLEKDSVVNLASGYFNLTSEYTNCLLHKSEAKYSIICAHPKANGFLGSGGFTGAIPSGYTQLAKMFYSAVCRSRQQSRINLFEYQRDGWTFHAKGLWHSSHEGIPPFLTMIGSPNFGHRSVKRDLESQAVLITRNRDLQRSLQQECSALYQYSEPVTSATYASAARFVPLWVRLIMPIIKIFF